MIIIQLSLRNVLIGSALVAFPIVVAQSLNAAHKPTTAYGRFINSILRKVVEA